MPALHHVEDTVLCPLYPSQTFPPSETVLSYSYPATSRQPSSPMVTPGIPHSGPRLMIYSSEAASLSIEHSPSCRGNTSLHAHASKSFTERLPVELLQEVFFEICCDAPAIIRGRAAPLRLSHVCERWRQVAISTPALWARMLVDLELRKKYHSSPHLLKLWLQRSLPLPLTLWIVDLDVPDPSAVANVLLAILLDHIHRWGNVQWLVRDSTAAEQFLQHSINCETVLETLEISTGRGCTGDQIERFPFALRSFKHLRRLTYRAMNTPMTLFDLPLVQLTHLHLSCAIPLDTCQTLLAQCTNLVDLSVADVRGPVADITAETKIFLPALVSCSLSSFLCDIGMLLARIICPSARSLALHCPYSLLGDWRDLEAFFARSNCHPEVFTLYDAGTLDCDLARLLSMANLQSVGSLNLNCRNLSDQTLILLTGGDSNAGALPYLKTIRLSLYSSSDGKLAEMISSRWNGIPKPSECRLSYVEVAFRNALATSDLGEDKQAAIREAHKADIMCFERVKDEGLDLIWSY